MIRIEDLRVAVVHEWVDSYAGSEQVFEALAQLVPHADLYALSVTPGVTLDVGGRPVRTTVLDSDRLRHRRGITLPMMPFAWRALRAEGYDLVISSQHAFAHANRLAAPTGRHLSYVHSPARYVWNPEIDVRGAGRALGPARAALKSVDRRAARRVTSYAANSATVAARIRQHWHRDATVIHPPVRVEWFADHGVAEPSRDYVLGMGRWIPYKNLHHVVEAADEVGLPCVIAGRGPDRSRIEAAAAAASVPVTLVESPTDEQLRDLYANAACLVFPTVEDFGIVPVEAQATGTPVVALRAGGALETVVEGVSGAFADEVSREDLAAAVRRALPLAGDGPRKQAQHFSRAGFDRAVARWVEDATGIAGVGGGGQ